jgi:hypothetical protein
VCPPVHYFVELHFQDEFLINDLANSTRRPARQEACECCSINNQQQAAAVAAAAANANIKTAAAAAANHVPAY